MKHRPSVIALLLVSAIVLILPDLGQTFRGDTWTTPVVLLFGGILAKAAIVYGLYVLLIRFPVHRDTYVKLIGWALALLILPHALFLLANPSQHDTLSGLAPMLDLAVNILFSFELPLYAVIALSLYNFYLRGAKK